MSYLNQPLLEQLHNGNRRIIESKIFGFTAKTCLLDFINAPDYFITDFGMIWNRNRCYADSRDVVSKNYLPLVTLDTRFPYPWVYLNTKVGKIWLPVNQLLGWAFRQPKGDITVKYFLSDQPGVLPMTLSDHFTWTEQVTRPSQPSKYLKFMDQLYRTKSE